MRFGGNDAEVLARLAWLRDEFGPLFGAALRASGGVPLNPLIARGLTMGDEMHQRNVACTSLLLRTLLGLPRLAAESCQGAASSLPATTSSSSTSAMAMGKSILDPARGIAGSTIVTAMAATAPTSASASPGRASLVHRAGRDAAGPVLPRASAPPTPIPDMGDSAILEAIGLGAFAMAAAPAVAGFVGAGGFARRGRRPRAP